MKKLKLILAGLMAMALALSMISCDFLLDEEETTKQNTDNTNTDNGGG